MTSETTERYCPICGKPVLEPSYNRFGEWCCSEEHAEAYVKEVRAQRAQAAASQQGRPVRPSRGEEGTWYEEEPVPWWSRRPRWFGRRRRGC
jgi:predicted nucleic acid-binding Zn ribbon protein